MKKDLICILLMICLTISIMIFNVSDNEKTNVTDINEVEELNIGMIESISVNKSTGKVNYTEYVKREIIDFKNVYKQIQQQYINCSFYIDEKTFKNITNCWNVSYNITVIDKTKKGDPIYKYSYPNKVKIKEYTYDYKKNNGYVCGNFLLQVSKNDGGLFFDNPGKQKSICNGTHIIEHSGWDCYRITYIPTLEIIYEKRGYGCEI